MGKDGKYHFATYGADEESSTPIDLNDLLGGVVQPDVIVGFVNGSPIFPKHIPCSVVDKPDYREVRFTTSSRELIEIRYVEEIFSDMRRVAIEQAIRISQQLAKQSATIGKFIRPKRKPIRATIRKPRAEPEVRIPISEIMRKVEEMDKRREANRR
jgi:hypothetical protein